MALEEYVDKLLPKIIEGLEKCCECPVGANTEKGLNVGGQQAVHQVLNDLISVLFPGCHGRRPVKEGEMKEYLRENLKSAAVTLKQQAARAFEYQCSVENCENCDDCDEKAEDAVSHLIGHLPKTQKILQRDIMAAYEGDPAAKSAMEVVMSYPGFYAITVHRIAHLLYEKTVPVIPRIMSEYAHSRTGIDIHPGAQIGAGFFMDHGTGVVIGETCVIGENVKLYQGVTLGALSFEKDEDGKPVKGVKRHPDVGDNVVIYSGATILGKLTIGSNSVIGGNIWLIHSVPPNSKVYNQQPKPLITQAQSEEK
ncbi:serine O-acetyltransferase EpsC [Verrucomicrobiota bacterium]